MVTFFHSPQLVCYIGLSLKGKNSLEKLKFILSLIPKLPVIICIGLYSFVLPIPTHKLPFLKATKETWRYNYYPTLYMIVLNLLLTNYMYYLIYNVFINHSNLSLIIINNHKKEDFLLNKNNILYKMFVFISILLLIENILKLFIIIEQIYLNFIKKSKKRK